MSVRPTRTTGQKSVYIAAPGFARLEVGSVLEKPAAHSPDRCGVVIHEGFVELLWQRLMLPALLLLVMGH